VKIRQNAERGNILLKEGGLARKIRRGGRAGWLRCFSGRAVALEGLEKYDSNRGGLFAAKVREGR